MKGREPIPGVRGGGGGRKTEWELGKRWRKATENATGVKAGALRLDASR